MSNQATRPSPPTWPRPTQTRVDYANGALRIKAPKGWKRYTFRGGGESIDVRIELPTGSQLHGSAALAALRSRGTLGDCYYKTGGGDITMEQIAGTAELTSGIGAITRRADWRLGNHQEWQRRHPDRRGCR